MQSTISQKLTIDFKKRGKAEIYQKAEKNHPYKNVKNTIDEIKKISDHDCLLRSPSLK